MKIHNTLTRHIEHFEPIKPGEASIYTCGPTVYDRVHIGNLASFIYADTLRRILSNSGLTVKHIMNYTDIDDKTIKRSKESYPEQEPLVALQNLTDKEIINFNSDIKEVGIDTANINFIKATDSIDSMQKMIIELINKQYAYIAEDGIYFSIENYKKSGKKYGQLSNIDNASTSSARIDNDEYDKTSVHDFALWKFNKDNEPAWDFKINQEHFPGRPGWHIECSAMSEEMLSMPFDIHTGGIDLIFPHHENEIAQSTAGDRQDTLAKYFVHNEHLLIDNKKMSKSLNNFYTIEDIKTKRYNPMSLRLLVLQAHYRSILHFSWENLGAAQNRLNSYQAMSDLRWQAKNIESSFDNQYLNENLNSISGALNNDMNMPEALKILSTMENKINDELLSVDNLETFNIFIAKIDQLFGLNLTKADITDAQKEIIIKREQARSNKDFKKADELRDLLLKSNIEIRDTKYGTIWNRI
ncbi:MAG: cysteine--tRNA ligase [bacterium]